MAENIIITGQKEKTDKDKAWKIRNSLDQGKAVIVICDNPEKISEMAETEKTQIRTGNIRFGNLLSRAGVTPQETADMIAECIAWNWRHPLGNVESLVLSMMAEQAYKSGDLFSGITEVNFREIFKTDKGKADTLSLRKKEAQMAFESLREKIKALGFGRKDGDVVAGLPKKGEVLYIRSDSVCLCSLFLLCAYRLADKDTEIFAPGYIHKSINMLPEAMKKDIGTFITIPSLDYLEIFYPGRFREILSMFDRIVLHGEQMIRKHTAGILAGMCTDTESKGLLTESLFCMQEDEIYMIEGSGILRHRISIEGIT